MAPQPCLECGMTGAAHRPTCKLLSTLPMEEVKLHLEHLLGERDEEIQRLKLQNETLKKEQGISWELLKKRLEDSEEKLKESNRLNQEYKTALESIATLAIEFGCGCESMQRTAARALQQTEKRVEPVQKLGHCYGVRCNVDLCRCVCDRCLRV